MTMVPLAIVAISLALQSLSDRIEALRQRSGSPGASVAVLEGGTIVFAEGFGVRRKGGDGRVDRDTLFQAGSVSKPVAALAALRLVSTRRLNLDRDVSELLTSWVVPPSPLAEGKPITLRRLLSHTAGLSVHGFTGYFEDEEVPELIAVLDGAAPANSPPIVVELEPGTRWKYSGGGYCVMQQLLLDVTQRPFPPLVHELVFEPLAMTRSTYAQPLPESLRANAAAGHFFPPKPVPGDAPTQPEMAAAGLWTTPSDLLRCGLAMQRSFSATGAGAKEPFLPQELAREALRTHGVQANGEGYGLGFGLSLAAGLPAFGHGGSNQGFKASLILLRDSERGVAVMTNGDGGGAMLQPVADLVADTFGWARPAAPPAR